MYHFLIYQEGSIGHDVVIKPVPSGIIKSDVDDTAHHIVYKRKTDPMDLSDFGKFLLLLINILYIQLSFD